MPHDLFPAPKTAPKTATETASTPHDASNDLQKQLDGYRLTTAEILYHLPDHPSLLQSYLWQEYDLAPRFPRLKLFLDFWSRNLDGALHSVKVTSTGIITPAEWRSVGGDFRLQ